MCRASLTNYYHVTNLTSMVYTSLLENVTAMARKLTKKEIEQLKEFQKDIRKHTNRITKMGFNIYVTQDSINIMDGDTHDNETGHPNHENVVYEINAYGWDCGAW